MPSRRALLIGINRYLYGPSLAGCVSDALLMRAILQESFGFTDQQITLVTDAAATRAGILAAFDALVDATAPGDLVLIYYAGHGSRMTDREGDEPSGFDSTIVPCDSGRKLIPNRDITDDEIHLKLAALAGIPACTTLIFDCCHSGTLARNAFATNVRAMEPDCRPVSALPPSPVAATLRTRTRGADSAWAPLGGSYVMLSGCRDDEESYEYRPPEGRGRVVHGALTFFVSQELRLSSAGTTWRDIYERAAARVTAAYSRQHPQIEGQIDREIFGVADLRPNPYVEVRSRIGANVEVAAGAAHACTTGSQYAVYAAGSKTPSPEAQLGEIELTEIGVVTSRARVTRENGAGAIGGGARAFEKLHAYESPFAVVIVDEPDPAERLEAPASIGSGGTVDRIALAPAKTATRGEAVRSLRDALARAQITCVDDASAAWARISLIDAGREPGHDPGTQPRGAGEAPCWTVTGPSGDLLMPPKRLAEGVAVIENLQRLARSRQVLNTDNPDPRSRIRGRIMLDLLRRGSDRRWRPASKAANHPVVFEEGEPIAFRITNRHSDPLYVALIDLGVSGAIEVITHGEAVAPGRSWDIGADGEFAIRLPDGYPFVPTVGAAASTDAVETIKLFATESPAAFRTLEQSGVRSAAVAPAAASALLRDALSGTPTRGPAFAEPGSDWTTITRSFRIRRQGS
jgi:hypothetical protein